MHQGENYEYIPVPLGYAMYLVLNQTGAIKATVYTDEPAWAKDENSNNVKIYDYDIVGWSEFPKIYNLVDFNSDTIRTGDFLMLTAKLDHPEDNIEIELLGELLTPLKMTIRYYRD